MSPRAELKKFYNYWRLLTPQTTTLFSVTKMASPPMTSPVTVTINSQISQKTATFMNISPQTLLAVVKGSKSKAAVELANRLLPILEDLNK